MSTSWSFLTNHARALLFIAGDAEARLRDIAAAINVTERTAYAIVADLAEVGYVVKERDGRRNRYHVQEHLPLSTEDRHKPAASQPTIGELLILLSDAELGGTATTGA